MLRCSSTSLSIKKSSVRGNGAVRRLAMQDGRNMRRGSCIYTVTHVELRDLRGVLLSASPIEFVFVFFSKMHPFKKNGEGPLLKHP